jgi:DNA/RNA-binding domain of Phe-tRNA-synthetase-like protein
LERAHVDRSVFELRRDYRALLVMAEGVRAGPSDAISEMLLAAAEERARSFLAEAPPEALPHVAAWREAFRSFGAKPQKTRPSVEGLLRRATTGLPRVDRLTDAYNAVSVAHVVPVGGEDVDRYVGPLRLVRATGEERFDTTKDGQSVVDHPEPGEVVWRDDDGVTCRCWNWRQCTRTRLSPATTRAVFVIDALSPMDDDALAAAGEALSDALRATSPEVRLSIRILGR